MSRFERKLRRAATKPTRAVAEQVLAAIDRHSPESLTPKGQARVEALKRQQR